MAKKKKPPDSIIIRMGEFRVEVSRTRRKKRGTIREPPKRVLERTATHAKDFSTVNWFGDQFEFTVSQRGPVRILWEAWLEGDNGVSAAAIVEAAETDDEDPRPSKIFGDNPAWGTMIRKVKSKRDIYKLFPPDPTGEQEP